MRFLLGLLSLISLGHAADPAGFQNLFNGQDLSGWQGDRAFWSVRDGAITGQTTAEDPAKENTFLIWGDGEVRNFELRTSFRLTADNARAFANSGIQYRSRILDAAKFAVGGYQGDMDGEGKYVGMLYEEQGRGIIAKPGEQVRIFTTHGKTEIKVTGATTTPAKLAQAVHPGAWNEYVIVAEGNRLRHFINGTLTADVTDLDEVRAAQSGVLAFQLHTGLPMTVQFKNIRLKTLP